MELKEYLKIIKKNRKLIIVVGIITAVSAFVFSVAQPVKYETSLSLAVIKDKTQSTDDFKYDGYYAFQGSEIIADSIEQWLKSPGAVNKIYQKSEVNQDFKSIKSYTKKFTAKKMSSQQVEVRFRTNTREESEKISQAVMEVMNTKIEKLKEASEQEISFSVSSENPVVIKSKPDAILNLIIGLISGLFVGIFFVFLRRYLSLSF
jgi:capsular polysaccharide biosynthesis protein